MQDSNSFQIFRKAIWKHADVQVSSSQHSLYVTTQHFGITASYIDTIFLVGYTACKVRPPFNILYLIKEEDGLTFIHAMIGLQYEI